MIQRKEEPQTAATVTGANEIKLHEDYITACVIAQTRLSVIENVCQRLADEGRTTIHIDTVLMIARGCEK